MGVLRRHYAFRRNPASQNPVNINRTVPVPGTANSLYLTLANPQMTSTNENHGKAEDIFSQFGKNVDKFIAELKEAGTKLSEEFEKRFEELKESAQRIREESKNKERWKEVEDSLKRAATELKNAFNAAFKTKT